MFWCPYTLANMSVSNRPPEVKIHPGGSGLTKPASHPALDYVSNAVQELGAYIKRKSFFFPNAVNFDGYCVRIASPFQVKIEPLDSSWTGIENSHRLI